MLIASNIGIRNENDHNAVYVFDYNEQTGKCELWYTLENYWYVILGSKKIANLFLLKNPSNFHIFVDSQR